VNLKKGSPACVSKVATSLSHCLTHNNNQSQPLIFLFKETWIGKTYRTELGWPWAEPWEQDPAAWTTGATWPTEIKEKMEGKCHFILMKMFYYSYQKTQLSIESFN